MLLGAQSSQVELVAVNLNPLYGGLAYTRAFDQEQSLNHVRNWVYLTGSTAQLRPVWRSYGVESQTLPGGSMIGHNDVAFVIDPNGRMREELDFRSGSRHHGDGVLVRLGAGHGGPPQALAS